VLWDTLGWAKIIPTRLFLGIVLRWSTKENYFVASSSTVSQIRQKSGLLNSKTASGDPQSCRFHPLSTSIGRFFPDGRPRRASGSKKTVTELPRASIGSTS
jgi:hypothetical protein